MIFDLNIPDGEFLKQPPALSFKEVDNEYIASEKLSMAVWTALTLGQPLLLTGEPGSGKTQLAYYLAKRLNIKDVQVFNAQTSSAKKDLFYTYDALGHFQWAQIERAKAMDADTVGKKFIRYVALGKAIQLAKMENKQSVVLIDEIDKAPRDLANDLLGALDTLSFEVPEIPGDNIKPWECPENLRPIIIITSNSEKNLPDAFLRRVVYHHIDFPDEATLLKIIVAKKITSLSEVDTKIVIKHFMEIRSEEVGLSKTPATAELIQWAILLPKLGVPVAKLKNVKKLKLTERQLLNTSYGVLAKTKEDLEKLINR